MEQEIRRCPRFAFSVAKVDKIGSTAVFAASFAALPESSRRAVGNYGVSKKTRRNTD